MNRFFFVFLIVFALQVPQMAGPPDVFAQEVSGSIEFSHDLLFSEADVAVMKKRTNLPVFADFWDETLDLDATDDGNFMREAFIYVMTGDSARGQNAKRLVLAQAEEDYWNRFVDGDKPLGFLMAGRLTAWMALSYDWLYELFSEAERAEIRKAIADKGCAPLYLALRGMRYPETVTGWAYAPYSPSLPRIENIDMSRWPHILGHNNFRAIINGGLTLGLIVLEGHDDRVDEWKEMVLDSIVRFNALLKDDGSYDEAVAYLDYAMTYQTYAMEGARRHLGRDFFDTANFQGMMDYVLAMYLPSEMFEHGSITFGDAHRSLLSSKAFWVARNARDGVAQYIGLNYSEHELLSLLYYDPTVRPEAPGDEGHLVELDLDWIVSRSGYEKEDFVVGMRSGGPMNHEHGDRNSIQLKAYGEILLADHSRLTYFSEDPEWAWRGSLGHNAVLIDGVGHQYHEGEEGTNESKAHATIGRSGVRDGYHFWASDATQAYELVHPDVGSVTRTLVSFPEAPAVVVIDKVIKEVEPSLISNRWQVENRDGEGSVTVGEGSFTIHRPTSRFFAAVAGGADQRMEEGRFESANKDHPFVYVQVSDGDSLKTSLKLMVGIPLRSGEPDPMVDFERNGDEWTARIQKAGSVIALRILDRGSLPEFEVLRNDWR